MKAIKAITVLMLCGLLVLAANPAWGGKKKVKDLTYPPLNKFDIPEPDRYVLDNGMTVYLLEDPTLPKINLYASLNKCGSYLEPPSKIGLASMTGTVMRTGGTTSKAGDAIDEELEAIGAFVETGIGKTSGSASANALTEYGETIIAVLADVLRNPVFDEDKIELARTTARTGISRRNDDPMDICIREFRKLMFGADSPYARHSEYATIDAITRDDMVKFHQMFVHPNNVQLAVWGDFNSDEMLALIKQYMGDWPRSAQEIPGPPKFEYTFRPTVNYAEKTDINQSQILVGHIGGMMGDPDYPATIVMNAVLGGSFGSRLTDNIRTRLGLAYTAMGNFSFGYDYPGWFYSYAATKSESTVKAIREMFVQIKSMQTDPPTEEEMRRAKDGWLNAFVFNFDTKGEIISRMMTYDYYGMPHDYLQQLKEAVEKVTPEDVIEVSQRKLNPDNLQILAVGKGEEFDEPLSVFGEVNEIDITIPTPAVEDFAATEEQLAEGKAILVKAAEACGGVENFKKVQSIVSEADLTLNTPQGAMTMGLSSIQVIPDKSAQTINTPMGDQVIVFDGSSGWISAGGQTQAMPTNQVEDKKKGLVRNMVVMFARCDQLDFVKVASKGQEEFNGQPALRLDFMTESGGQFTMYVDPASHYPVGMQYMGETMMGPGEIVEKMSDYKEFNGIMMPTKMIEEGGGMTFEVEMTRIDINAEYDASIFNKPEGI
jgi:predicted Zn-dependent peptidase